MQHLVEWACRWDARLGLGRKGNMERAALGDSSIFSCLPAIRLL